MAPPPPTPGSGGIDRRTLLKATTATTATAGAIAAAVKGVPLIDLTASSTTLWNRVGVEETKKYFMILPARHDQCVLPSGDFQRLTATVPTSAIVWPTTAPY